MFRQLTIIAPGLLGASLGMACRQRQLAARIKVWARRSEARQACAEQPWCDGAPDSPGEAVEGADFVVLCPPVAHILPLLEQIVPHLSSGAIVTDVGSTKGRLCHEAADLLPPNRHFVGAHPMAGSEKSGMDHAFPELFEGRPCFITPDAATPAAIVGQVDRFWQAVGMRTHLTSAEEHDAIVAHLSHLPHMIASALSVALERSAGNTERFAGPGLRDTTRVAAGSPVMWRSICEHNREAILSALGDFEKGLSAITEALQKEDFAQLEALLEEGRQYRQRLDSGAHD